jgi:hypothetical protein
MTSNMSKMINLPTIVLMRTVRPYVKVFIFLVWVYIRVIREESTEETCQGLQYEMECRKEFAVTQGLLHKIQISFAVLSSASTEFISQQSGSVLFHRLASRFFLYANDLLGIILIVGFLRTIQSIQQCTFSELKDRSVQYIFDFAKENISFVTKELAKEEDKMELSLKESLWGERKTLTKVLPKEGSNVLDLLQVCIKGGTLNEWRERCCAMTYSFFCIYTPNLKQDLTARSEIENKRWEDGLVSGTVYGGEKQHTDLLNQVYSLFSLSNPLHPDIWPSINQCEAEVISMTTNLLNGGDKHVVGCMTSGGTESIVMAVRAHLQLYGKARGIKSPEIISGVTAHAGLNKACEMFGIRLIQVPCDESNGYQMDAKEVEKRMSMNVIMIYSSAPSYPQGVIDPIWDLSNIAIKFAIGLHVDACLGGFVLPFARMMKYDVPTFDFGCPGVTSMSADTHKYGYASKGTSIVLYRNKVCEKINGFSLDFIDYAFLSRQLLSQRI